MTSEASYAMLRDNYIINAVTGSSMFLRGLYRKLPVDARQYPIKTELAFERPPESVLQRSVGADGYRPVYRQDMSVSV